MTLSIKPAKSGGRVAQGDTPYGRFQVDFHPEAHGARCNIVTADGRVVGEAFIEITQPDQAASQPKKESAAGSCSLLLKPAIRKLIGDVPCGMCHEHCKTMDERGWAWCIRNLPTIARWLKASADRRAEQLEQAAEQAKAKAATARRSADAINPDKALSVLMAAWRELRG